MEKTVKSNDSTAASAAPRFNLAFRILFTIGIFLFVISIGSSLFILQSQREIYLSNPSMSPGITANHNVQLLEQRIAILKQDISFLAETRAIVTKNVEFSENPSESWQSDIADMFAAFSASHPEYQQLRYIGFADKGLELVRTNVVNGEAIRVPKAELQHKGGKQYFNRALTLVRDEIYISGIDLNEELGKIERPVRPTIRALMTVMKPNGEKFGFIIINLDLTKTLQSLTDALPAGFLTYAMNTQGDFLIHPDNTHTFGSEFGTGYSWPREMPTLKLPVSRMKNVIPNMQRVESKQGTLQIAVDHLDLNPKQSIYLAYALPETYINHYLFKRLFPTLATIFLLSTLCFFVIYYLITRTFSPLKQLTQVAARISEGDYDVRLPRSSVGEMKTYILAFKTMLDNLKQRQAEVQTNLKTLEQNQLQLQTTLDNLTEGVLVVSMEGKVLEFNQSATEMFGLTASDDTEKFLATFSDNFQFLTLDGELLDPSEWPAPRIIAGEKVEDLELQVQNIFTDWRRIFSYNGEVIKGQDGVPQLTIITIRDVTTQKLLSLQNQRAEERFKFVTSRVEGYAFLILNSEAQISAWNLGAKNLFGYGKSEIIGITYEKLYREEDIQQGLTRGYIERAEAEGQFEYVGWFLRSDGSTFFADSVITSMHNDFGKLIGFLMVVRDITDRQQKESALRAAEIADSANIAKSEFLASMSHELRTPLNAIIGYSEILIEDAVEAGEPEPIADLNKIRGAGNHLLTLINDILDFSKIEAGKMELTIEPVLIPELVNEIADTFTPLINKNSNTLTIECDPNFGWLKTDPTRLRQLLYNLLSNAAKFTTDGEIYLRIRRETKTDDPDDIIIQIQDTGIGIPSDQLPSLFDPFKQVNPETSKNLSGTGLGLAITQQLVKLFAGRITVTSELDVGTTFTVTLPDKLANSAQTLPED